MGKVWILACGLSVGGCILVEETGPEGDLGCVDGGVDGDGDADADADSDSDDVGVDPGPQCVEDADCDAGLACAGGRCLSPDDLCTWSWQCGPGDECIDGLCRPLCTDDAACPAGTACVEGVCEDAAAECDDDADCGVGLCRGGACCNRCLDEAGCGADEACDDGACVWDWGGEPFCSADDDCAVGHRCVEGVCRSPCATDDDCARFDVVFTFCGEAGLCLAANEVAPECALPSDCTSPDRCWDAICR